MLRVRHAYENKCVLVIEHTYYNNTTHNYGPQIQNLQIKSHILTINFVI